MRPSLIVSFLAWLAVSLPTMAAETGPGEPAIDEAGGLPKGYALAWADEFEKDGLPDPTKWLHDTHRNRIGWYNSERQYYSDARKENARIEEGRLIIEARRERREDQGDWGGQEYSSARLLTRGHAEWTYGFFEVRAKLPCGVGTWPAIWMLGAPPNTRWPHDGEIDIMEMVGFDPEVIHGSVHTLAYYHSIGTHRTNTRTVKGACGDFHRYQLLWTPERITIGVDDRNYFQFANDKADDRATWPFDKPQYMILNLAVGGMWGGMKGIDDKIFPVQMEVDYVRVYQAAGETAKTPAATAK